MARSDTRYSVYPDPDAVEVLGNKTPALNQAIECWAALLARGMADNDRTFEQSDPVVMHYDKMGQMNEWSLLAEAIKGMRFDPKFANPGQLLATAVEDAHRFEYIGAECFNMGGFDSTVIKPKDIDFAVEKVVEKLRDPQFEYFHAWAVIVAIRWFWEHHDEGIDVKEDPWWTLKFRRQWNQNHSGSKQGAATSEQERAGKSRHRKKPSNQ